MLLPSSSDPHLNLYTFASQKELNVRVGSEQLRYQLPSLLIGWQMYVSNHGNANSQSPPCDWLLEKL